MEFSPSTRLVSHSLAYPQPPLVSTPQPQLATFEMFFNNNFANTTSGYPVPDNKSLGFNGNLFEVTNDGPLDCSGFGLGAGIGSLSAAEIEDWWLAPKPDGNAGQYLGSTLLGTFRNELASPHDSQNGLTPETSGIIRSKSYCSLSSTTYGVSSANGSLRWSLRI